MEAPKAEATTTEQIKPDFTGEWLNVEMEGDVPTFIEKGMELPWMMRKMMSGANYGKGKLKHWLTMSEDRMMMSTDLDFQGKTPAKFSKMVAIDGQEFTDDKGKNPAKLEWVFPGDGKPGYLLLTPNYEKGAASGSFVMERHMLPDGRMSTVLSYPNKSPDLTMSRFFEKVK